MSRLSLFHLVFYILLFCGFFPCFSQKLTPDLEIIQLAEGVYIHKAWTHHEPYGRFSSNGLIYVRGNEALVLDTPMDDSTNLRLLQWLEEEKGFKIVGLVINHFHDDGGMGGIRYYQERGIPAYASNKCIEIAMEKGLPIPEHGFNRQKKLKIGTSKVVCYYPGEAHAPDNIVCWFEEEKILFGGCMIKSLKAGKGNLADANVEQWPASVDNIRRKFPYIQTVIPGHGKHGGTDLLDFTSKMFSENTD